MNRSWVVALLAVFVSGSIVSADPVDPPPPVDVLPYTIKIPKLLPLEPLKLPKIWSGQLEFGANGASGNSELLSLRVGGKIKRETAENISTFDWVYRYTTSDGIKSENRALLNGKSEWPFHDSPWSCFVSGTTEYDEFKEFDVRVAAHGGVGYHWIKTDSTSFKTRLGAGASREIGGVSNRLVPEALVGAEFEHKFSDRQKFTASAEFFPDLGDFSNFRTISKAGYELLVDPDWNITLKLGVLHRHDSTPEGRLPNDIEYYGTLVWSY